MATINVLTDAPTLSEHEHVEFIENLGEAVRTGLDLAPGLKSVYYQQFDSVNTTKKPKPEMTLFIYTAPDKTTDQKRRVIASTKTVIDETFGKDAINAVVIFKIHDDENVGVNGVLRKDAKAK